MGHQTISSGGCKLKRDAGVSAADPDADEPSERIWLKLSLRVRIGADVSNESTVVNPARSSEENVTEGGGSVNWIEDGASSRMDSGSGMKDFNSNSTKKNVGLRFEIRLEWR